MHGRVACQLACGPCCIYILFSYIDAVLVDKILMLVIFTEHMAPRLSCLLEHLLTCQLIQHFFNCYDGQTF